MTADQRANLQVLDIALTDSGWVCTLSVGEVVHHKTDPIRGSLESLRNAIFASGMAAELIVTTLPHGLTIDVLPPGGASPQTWLAADEWAELADSLNGDYWTPREPLEVSYIARVYFQGTNFIQVKVHKDVEGSGIIGCPSHVYMSVRPSVSDATTAAICRLAGACCGPAALAVMAARLQVLTRA